MSKKIKVKLTIYGRTYTIVGNEEPEYIKEVGKYVDSKMRMFSQSDALLDTTTLSMLSALNIADEYLKAKKELEELKQTLKKE